MIAPRRKPREPADHRSGGSGLILYDQMVTAIAECARIDEVKEIRDKAQALEMYHKQAQNFEAEREAANVRLRAERRVGELLKELARATPEQAGSQGGRGAKKSLSRDVTSFASPYQAALEEHGISRQKAHRYQRLADVPEKVFEDALSGPEKPSAVRIAAYAKVREAGDPIPDFNLHAAWIWGRLRDFENRGILSMTPKKLLGGMTDGMIADVRRLAPRVREYLQEMEAANESA